MLLLDKLIREHLAVVIVFHFVSLDVTSFSIIKDLLVQAFHA